MKNININDTVNMVRKSKNDKYLKLCIEAVLKNCKDMIKTAYCLGDSIFFIKETKDYPIGYVLSDNKFEVEQIIEFFKSKNVLDFGLIRDWIVDLIMKDNKEFRNKEETYFLYMPAERDIPKIDIDIEVEILPVTINDARIIAEKWHTVYKDKLDFVKDAIERDIAVKALINNKIVGWQLIDDQNALGLIHVLNEYRGKGLSKILITEVAKKLRENGREVYCNALISDNRAISMLKNLGFECNTNFKVLWFGINS